MSQSPDVRLVTESALATSIAEVVLVLNEGDPIPVGTPVNTIVVRRAA